MNHIEALKKIHTQTLGRGIPKIEQALQAVIDDMEFDGRTTVDKAVDMFTSQTQVKQKLTDLNKLHNPHVTFGNDH